MKNKIIDKLCNKSGQVTTNGINAVNHRRISNSLFENINSDAKTTTNEYMEKLVDITFNKSNDILSMMSGSDITDGFNSLMSEMEEVGQAGISRLNDFNSKVQNDKTLFSTNPFDRLG